jgi:hydroxymethylglutaryl-CoA synthase
MVGIRSYGAYVPKYRLTKETKGWGFAGEKAVANFDEDSVTMAVAAAADCLAELDRGLVDGVIFATTTSPYEEKQGAATIATALDLRTDIFTSDVGNVLRAGTSALRAASDAIRGGSAKNVLVIAADQRMAAPKSAQDRSMGDGAAALLISGDDVVAEIEGFHSISEHMIDIWRSAGSDFIQTGEERFIADEGYNRLMREAVDALLEKQGIAIGDIARAAYSSWDPRRHAELSRLLGLDPAQVQDPLYGQMGNTGTAFPLMLLVAALEEVDPGDRLLVAAYGDGADTLLLRATNALLPRPERRGVRMHLETRAVIEDYDALLQWRQLLGKEMARRPSPMEVSLQAAWRERDQNLKLHGGRCTSCGHITYPPQRVCPFCNAKDEVEPVRLADKRGELFTYSMDYVGGTPDVPSVIAVVNFEGGGRIMCMLTDRDVELIRIGMPVEMTFRTIGVVKGVHIYYWKAMPVREPVAVLA